MIASLSTRLPHLPARSQPVVTTFSAEEARAEARFESHRLERLRSFDNQAGDLDPHPDRILFDHPGHSMAPPSWGRAQFQEAVASDGAPAELHYRTEQAITLLPTPPGPWINDLGQPVPPPSGAALLSITEGRHDPATGTWEIARYTSSPSQETLEELRLGPDQGSKTVWNLKA